MSNNEVVTMAQLASMPIFTRLGDELIVASSHEHYTMIFENDTIAKREQSIMIANGYHFVKPDDLESMFPDCWDWGIQHEPSNLNRRTIARAIVGLAILR